MNASRCARTSSRRRKSPRPENHTTAFPCRRKFARSLTTTSLGSTNQRIELAEAVSDRAAVKARGEFTCARIDIVNVANVPVVDFLVVVVLDLHDLVTRREGPAK